MGPLSNAPFLTGHYLGGPFAGPNDKPGETRNLPGKRRLQGRHRRPGTASWVLGGGRLGAADDRGLVKLQLSACVALFSDVLRVRPVLALSRAPSKLQSGVKALSGYLGSQQKLAYLFFYTLDACRPCTHAQSKPAQTGVRCRVGAHFQPPPPTPPPTSHPL